MLTILLLVSFCYAQLHPGQINIQIFSANQLTKNSETFLSLPDLSDRRSSEKSGFINKGSSDQDSEPNSKLENLSGQTIVNQPEEVPTADSIIETVDDLSSEIGSCTTNDYFGFSSIKGIFVPSTSGSKLGVKVVIDFCSSVFLSYFSVELSFVNGNPIFQIIVDILKSYYYGETESIDFQTDIDTLVPPGNYTIKVCIADINNVVIDCASTEIIIK